MPLVVDASVGLKWVLQEPDSPAAFRLAASDEILLMPDFWLNEACNVVWSKARRRLITAQEARKGLDLFRTFIKPTPTGHLDLHVLALDIGIAIDHPVYDTMYVAFALAIGADTIVTADIPFTRAMRTHPDPSVARMMIPLGEWDSERER